MRSFVLILVLAIALPIDAIACEQNFRSRISNTTLADGEIIRREFELIVSVSDALRAPLWVPGETELAMSPEEAVEVLFEWLAENSKEVDEQSVVSIAYQGCLYEPGFRMYDIKIYPQGRFAVLFDGTVIPEIDVTDQKSTSSDGAAAESESIVG